MNLRICFVGDSFVNGTGDPNCLGWAGRVCCAARGEGHDITYYNLGIRRETSADIKRRWKQEVIPRLPDCNEGRIVFSFGVNDTTIEADQRRVERHDSIQNAYEILAAAQQVSPTLMIGPPPIEDVTQNARISDLSAAFALVCKNLNIPYLAVFDALVSSQRWMNEVAMNDGAHPYADGYEKLTKLVRTWPEWQNFLLTRQL